MSRASRAAWLSRVCILSLAAGCTKPSDTGDEGISCDPSELKLGHDSPHVSLLLDFDDAGFASVRMRRVFRVWMRMIVVVVWGMGVRAIGVGVMGV